MKETFMAFGVLVEVVNEGNPEYKSHEFGKFLDRWGCETPHQQQLPRAIERAG